MAKDLKKVIFEHKNVELSKIKLQM